MFPLEVSQPENSKYIICFQIAMQLQYHTMFRNSHRGLGQANLFFTRNTFKKNLSSQKAKTRQSDHSWYHLLCKVMILKWKGQLLQITIVVYLKSKLFKECELQVLSSMPTMESEIETSTKADNLLRHIHKGKRLSLGLDRVRVSDKSLHYAINRSQHQHNGFALLDRDRLEAP